MNTTLFTDGKSAFEYLIKTINTAVTSIEMQMFIWRNDEIGNLVAQALLNAANRGVKITLSKDLLGATFEYAEESKQSFFHHRLPLKLKLAASILDYGYQVKGKPKGFKQIPSQLSYQLSQHSNITLHIDKIQHNHSKYFIFDERILVISGMNIEYKEWKVDLLGRKYHDYMVAFEEVNYVEAFKESLKKGGQINRDLGIDHDTTLDFAMNLITKDKKIFLAKESLIQRIRQAKKNITIVMAYIGDQTITNELISLADKGIVITLCLPEKANLQNDLNLHHVKKLMFATKNKVHLYLCKNMIHGKLILIDEDYITLGSLNLNAQAMNYLQETNVGFRLNEPDLKRQIIGNITTIKEQSTHIKDPNQIQINTFHLMMESAFAPK